MPDIDAIAQTAFDDAMEGEAGSIEGPSLDDIANREFGESWWRPEHLLTFTDSTYRCLSPLRRS